MIGEHDLTADLGGLYTLNMLHAEFEDDLVWKRKGKRHMGSQRMVLRYGAQPHCQTMLFQSEIMVLDLLHWDKDGTSIDA